MRIRMHLPCLSRVSLLALTFALFFHPHTVLGLQFKGADISSLTIVEEAGVAFEDTDGNPASGLAILKEHGMNTARVRVWTAGTYTTDYAVTLAKVPQF